jgi:hypothetical protein
VPLGLARLAWQAGGVSMLAREALMPRRLGRASLFAAAVAAAAWAAWSRPPVGPALESRPADRHGAAAGRVHKSLPGAQILPEPTAARAAGAGTG